MNVKTVSLGVIMAAVLAVTTQVSAAESQEVAYMGLHTDQYKGVGLSTFGKTENYTLFFNSHGLNRKPNTIDMELVFTTGYDIQDNMYLGAGLGGYWFTYPESKSILYDDGGLLAAVQAIYKISSAWAIHANVSAPVSGIYIGTRWTVSLGYNVGDE